MARVAYVDHSYHKTTKSTDFLPQILRKYGHTVDLFWDEAWQGGAHIEWGAVASHDVVIMFQSYCPPPAGLSFRQLHPNVIYVPMLDQFSLSKGPLSNLASFWEPFQGSKVLNFSNALHCMTTAFGIVSHFVRYYPPMVDYPPAPGQGLHGFFWIRRENELPWQIVRTLIGNSRFDSFHIHLATDPGTPHAQLPSADDVTRHTITTSKWFEDKADLNARIARANIYFAPRLEEGIGQAFLEAMARGQCVIAPNHGTMNEYILPGLNGLLYDINNPRPLDFSKVGELGRQAKKTAYVGRRLWEEAEQELLQFVLAPSECLYVGRYQHPILTISSAPSPRFVPVDPEGGNSLIRALRRVLGRYAFVRATWRGVRNSIRFARRI
ncbi:glycosyltransferase [Bradyrhizobium sp. ARR65]|uniref:glycosyltransferase n=1 Tax=Bradyrhizobium sp. ARR65 TaxID=1040989 RepID=UPI0004656F6E|nr:glycosyltransferase [Bradyrhizobium sp. ARR65]